MFHWGGWCLRILVIEPLCLPFRTLMGLEVLPPYNEEEFQALEDDENRRKVGKGERNIKDFFDLIVSMCMRFAIHAAILWFKSWNDEHADRNFVLFVTLIPIGYGVSMIVEYFLLLNTTWLTAGLLTTKVRVLFYPWSVVRGQLPGPADAQTEAFQKC